MITTEAEIGATTDPEWHEADTMGTTMGYCALLAMMTSLTLAAGGGRKSSFSSVHSLPSLGMVACTVRTQLTSLIRYIPAL